MRVLTWSRLALVTASVSIMAVVVGCGAAPSGSDPTVEGADQGATAKENGGEAAKRAEGLVLAPVPVMLPVSLWADTMYGSASACSLTAVPTPSALQAYQCTLGAEYLVNETVRYYVWACPTTMPASAIPTDGGFGIVPDGWGEEVTVTQYQEEGFACFGYPVSGYELVVDEAVRLKIRGGCNGGACGILNP